MAELITGGDGTAHVSSADDGALFASIVGTGSYAGKGIGEGLPLTVKDANHLTLGTGCAWHNGRGIRVPAQEDVLIESGTQAMRRWDKVVLRYIRGTDGIEAVEVHVIKGTAVAEASTPAYPPHETGSVLDGAEVSDMPIWGVKVNGITIEGTEKLFTEVPSLTDLLGLVNAASASIKALQDRASAIEAKNTQQDGSISDINGKNASQDSAINGKAPTSHASTGTGYGVGNGSVFGHVKLSDSTTWNSGAGSGVAATPAAVKAVRDSVDQSISMQSVGYGVTCHARASGKVGTASFTTSGSHMIGAGSEIALFTIPVGFRPPARCMSQVNTGFRSSNKRWDLWAVIEASGAVKLHNYGTDMVTFDYGRSYTATWPIA